METNETIETIQDAIDQFLYTQLLSEAEYVHGLWNAYIERGTVRLILDDGFLKYAENNLQCVWGYLVSIDFSRFPEGLTKEQLKEKLVLHLFSVLSAKI
ncbi:hypothetical protein [Shewanella algae]|uniref:hypothetical protein n=1 Tax=Shewanella algae TaxID=38313 RepID=UPI0031F50173